MILLLEQDRELRRVALGTPQGLLAFGFTSSVIVITLVLCSAIVLNIIYA